MDSFLEQYSYIAFLLVFVVEYLIGASKLKSNSTIDLALNIVKFIFGLDKKEEKKEESK